MKCHCSCHTFKSSTRPAFCLFRWYKRWLACGRPRSCCVAGSQCAGCSVSQYDHSTWHPQTSPLYLVPFYSLYNQGEVYTFTTTKWFVCVCVFFIFFLCFSFSSSQPGASLEQTHIFVLAHILRRPIIVYGVKYYKSFRGETLGYTRFQGEPAESLTDINMWFLFKAFVKRQSDV